MTDLPKFDLLVYGCIMGTPGITRATLENAFQPAYGYRSFKPVLKRLKKLGKIVFDRGGYFQVYNLPEMMGALTLAERRTWQAQIKFAKAARDLDEAHRATADALLVIAIDRLRDQDRAERRIRLKEHKRVFGK